MRKKQLSVIAILIALCMVLTGCRFSSSREAAAVQEASSRFTDSAQESEVLQTVEDISTENEAANPYESANVGDVITFGSYEQDNNSADGTEPIEWIVLDREEDELLLLSQYALDARQYNLTQTDATWESCTLRQWLNTDFLNQAFSPVEQGQILDTTVSGDDNVTWGTDAGPDTVDKVYLLSMAEAKRYLEVLDIGQCTATAYAQSRDIFEMRGYCFWWLRTPGSSLGMPTYVDQDGDVSSSGRSINFADGAVRPVIRITVYAQQAASGSLSENDDSGNSEEYKPGTTLFFGRYEQDNNLSNGQEEIEWIVLAREGDRALLISKYGLDQHTNHDAYTEVTWETCSLRAWLNDVFFDEAFSAEEAAAIQNTSVSAEDNPRFGTDAGEDTIDKVFLLSLTEAEYYLDTQSAKQVSPTAYAKAQGVSVYEDFCSWWLRSPGQSQNMAGYVYDDGSVIYQGSQVLRSYGGYFKDDCAVRPCLWVDLSAVFD